MDTETPAEARLRRAFSEWSRLRVQEEDGRCSVDEYWAAKVERDAAWAAVMQEQMAGLDAALDAARQPLEVV